MQSTDSAVAQLIAGFSFTYQPHSPAPSDIQLKEALVGEQQWQSEKQRREDRADDSPSWLEELNELDAKRAELRALAEEFHRHVPSDFQSEVTATPKSFNDVYRVTEKIRLSWERRSERDAFAKAREYLRKVGKAINNHSNVLRILPSSNDYASVFCGALTVFIEASSNHETISEGFALAVTDINDCISTVHEEVLNYKNNSAVQHLVLRLYCLIFSFLINVMKWYTDKKRKRMMRSLNENIYSKYQQQLQQIRYLSETIHRRMLNRDLAEIRGSLAAVVSLHQKEPLKFQIGLHEQPIDESYFERLAIRLRNENKKSMLEQRELFQQSVMEMLVPEASKVTAGIAGLRLLSIAAADSTSRPVSPVPTDNEQHSSSPPDASTSFQAEPTYTRQDILLHSAHLADFYDDRQISPFFPTLGNSLPTFLADAAAVSRIHSLTTSPTSSILHVRTPWEAAHETQASLLASRYATASRAAGVSVISFFCRLSRADPPAGRTRETVALVALAYAAIRQLAELLPESEGEAGGGRGRFGDAAFGPARFAALDGTLRTWDGALELLRDLVDANDEPLLYVVVDGVHLLEDASRRSTREALGRLVALLRRVVEERTERYLVKILFTTVGLSRVLNEMLDGRDVVTVSKPVGQGGVVRGGRRPL